MNSPSPATLIVLCFGCSREGSAYGTFTICHRLLPSPGLTEALWLAGLVLAEVRALDRVQGEGNKAGPDLEES